MALEFLLWLFVKTCGWLFTFVLVSVVLWGIAGWDTEADEVLLPASLIISTAIYIFFRNLRTRSHNVRYEEARRRGKCTFCLGSGKMPRSTMEDTYMDRCSYCNGTGQARGVGFR
jgi:hypothetical protein